MPDGSEKRRDLLLAKFRTTSVVEVSPGGETADLYRGNAMVAPPSAKACEFAARAGHGWLVRAEREGGRFPASCAPYAGQADPADCDALQQAFTALAMVRLHPVAPVDQAPEVPNGSRNLNRQTMSALSAARAMVVRDARTRFSYVAEGGESRMGPSAVLLVALCEESSLTGDREKNRELVASLSEFVLAQQTPDGEFLSHYDPAAGRPVKRFAETSFPGQAILALVRAYEFGGRKDARLLDAARKAAKRLAGSKEVDPWLMLGLEALVAVEKDDALAEDLLARALRIAEAQLTLAAPGPGRELPPGKTRCPDLVGGLDEADPPGVAMTAARGEGLAAALRAARRLSRTEEADRIVGAMERAAVYVVQNQFRAENSYALSRPERALGGFRTSALAGTIRPETTAHAALFLLDCANVGKPQP
jgi:hypothetical protein